MLAACWCTTRLRSNTREWRLLAVASGACMHASIATRFRTVASDGFETPSNASRCDMRATFWAAANELSLNVAISMAVKKFSTFRRVWVGFLDTGC